jgi:hypothetical protein
MYTEDQSVVFQINKMFTTLIILQKSSLRWQKTVSFFLKLLLMVIYVSIYHTSCTISWTNDSSLACHYSQ